MKNNDWIDESVIIDFKLPKSMLYLIEEIEKLAEEESEAFFNYTEALDDGAKELVVKGVLTQKQWDILTRKYGGGR